MHISFDTFRCVLVEKAKNSILEIRRGLGQFGYMMRSYSGNTMFDESFDTSNFRAIMSKMTLADLNRCLFRIDSEEKSDGYDFGVYDIPGSGPMTYCGLRGNICARWFTAIMKHWIVYFLLVISYMFPADILTFHCACACYVCARLCLAN